MRLANCRFWFAIQKCLENTRFCNQIYINSSSALLHPTREDNLVEDSIGTWIEQRTRFALKQIAITSRRAEVPFRSAKKSSVVTTSRLMRLERILFRKKCGKYRKKLRVSRNAWIKFETVNNGRERKNVRKFPVLCSRSPTKVVMNLT